MQHILAGHIQDRIINDSRSNRLTWFVCETWEEMQIELELTEKIEKRRMKSVVAFRCNSSVDSCSILWLFVGLRHPLS